MQTQLILRALRTNAANLALFDVIVAPGGDAPERLDAQPPDIIVLNTNMGVAHKRTIISALRVLAPRAGVIDLAEGAEEPGRDTGADAYLNEPFAVSELVQRIETLVHPPAGSGAGAPGFSASQAASLRDRSRPLREVSAEARERATEAQGRADAAMERALDVWERIRKPRGESS